MPKVNVPSEYMPMVSLSKAIFEVMAEVSKDKPIDIPPELRVYFDDDMLQAFMDVVKVTSAASIAVGVYMGLAVAFDNQYVIEWGNDRFKEYLDSIPIDKHAESLKLFHRALDHIIGEFIEGDYKIP